MVMRQNPGNNNNALNAFVNRIVEEKAKSVTAFCLIALMVFMWVRVIGRKTPATAEATSAQDANSYTSQADSDLRISFIELPRIKGRNDALKRDFFTVDDWQGFLNGRDNLISIEDADAASKDDAEETIRRVAGKLKLQAIWLGQSPQAFINDKLLSAGDKLSVRDGDNVYECTITGIEENKVSVKFGKAEFTLKLIQAVELTD